MSSFDNKITRKKLVRLTCFSAHEQFKINCKKEECRNWMDNPKYHNCAIIGAKNGPLKQDEIGEIFDITKTRMSQIENKIINKIKTLSKSDTNI